MPSILNHGIATPAPATPATPSCSSCSTTHPGTSAVYFLSSTTDSATKFPSIPPYFVFSIFVSASHIHWCISQKSRTSHSIFSREGWPASQRLRGSGYSRLHSEERARYVMMARLAGKHVFIHNISTSLGTDKPEPFRFSTSPSRGSSPNLSHGNSTQGPSSSTQSPRKTLTKNPNGVYRWQGAGSSRPRNRYQSPGFGSRPQQSRIKLSPPKTPLTTDTKRRRVGDEAESLAPQRSSVPSASGSTSAVGDPSSSSAPTSHPPQLGIHSPMPTPNGKTPAPPTPSAPVTPKANGVQGNRLRTTGLSATPAVPSPLRQTWKGNDSPPQPPQASRPTRAADFMTELLKEVTPPKKPDVSNPYQTASPVKPPPRKSQPKRQRPTPKPTEQPKEKGPELTAQEIIEATVPKARVLSSYYLI